MSAKDDECSPSSVRDLARSYRPQFMTNKLCCVLTPKYICKGCDKHWCETCANAYNWGKDEHRSAFNGDYSSNEDKARYTCPVGEFVYFHASQSVHKDPPYPLELQ